ncbi:hypothetical protein DM02DRAFT_670429 [Periconia macrospinosa]|uniref:Cyanovirin-N domain-containing protein n=1 Tax=Periconia macrospinosa TaxID=97972 RepID=A0A2V1DX18_9PLEO|nr:hypothetical protein DM02DRAFT_670429 [Periconia macrospinosa]
MHSSFVFTLALALLHPASIAAQSVCGSITCSSRCVFAKTVQLTCGNTAVTNSWSVVLENGGTGTAICSCDGRPKVTIT